MRFPCGAPLTGHHQRAGAMCTITATMPDGRCKKHSTMIERPPRPHVPRTQEYVRQYILDRTKRDENGCWIWQQRITRCGYGQARVSMKRAPSHRFSYEAFVGPIPDGYDVDHLCRVRACCNPEHLEAVTPAENNRRSNSISALNMRKTHCKHGHEFTPENTVPRMVNDHMARTCKTCKDISTRRWNAIASEKLRQARRQQQAS